jgi:hypothetical protein
MTVNNDKITSATPQFGFGAVAPIYQDGSWLPVPVLGKIVCVQGATGRLGSVTSEKVLEWRHQYPDANIGVVAHGWVAIDVDDHDDKHGGEQLIELERSYGKLPPTWKSSARDPKSPAGQLFFRVEEDMPYVSNPTKDIEIIHPMHRYSVVAPSVHPELKTEYVWYNPDGSPATEVPDVDALPELPLTWQLAFGKSNTMDWEDGSPYAGNAQEWIEWLDKGDPTYFSLQLLETISGIRHVGHQELMSLLIKVRDLQSLLWERGVRKVFDALHDKYIATTNENDPTKEFNNLLAWVIGSEWQPFPLPKSTAREIAINICIVIEACGQDDFWNSRESLRRIHGLSRKKVIAPYSLLGMVLIRVLHSVPWDVYYRSFRGSASLNSLAAFVGPTGTGKSLTLDVVESYVVFSDSPVSKGGDGSWTGVTEPGSGEAIPDHYMAWVVDEDDPKKSKKSDWKDDTHAAVFAFDEIGMLESRSAREGSTIIEYAKQGWSGSVLGRVLASGKGAMLPAKTYRFAMVLNIQPARAGMLFTDSAISGGLPSRFVFFSTQDPDGRKEFDPTPAKPIKLPFVNWVGVKYIDALPSMDAAHKEESFKAIDGGIDELDSHLLLTRAKVAVALAVMEGRSELIEEDWELSNFVIEHSKRTRANVLEVLRGQAGKEIARQGRAAGTRSAIATQVEDKRKIDYVISRIKVLREQGVPETGKNGLRKKLRNDQRKYFDEAIARISLEDSATTENTE